MGDAFWAIAANAIKERDELLVALEDAQEELRLIRMKDTDAVYDVTLRGRIKDVIAKVKGPATHG